MDVHALERPRRASSLTPSHGDGGVAHTCVSPSIALDTDSLFMCAVRQQHDQRDELDRQHVQHDEHDVRARLAGASVDRHDDIPHQCRQRSVHARSRTALDDSGARHLRQLLEEQLQQRRKQDHAHVRDPAVRRLSGTADGCSAFRHRLDQPVLPERHSRQNTDTVGSYSVNQVCTSIARSIPTAASTRCMRRPRTRPQLRRVSHALHQCEHRHRRAATNTIDKCFSGESVVYSNVTVACYSGATSLSGQRPGAPAGTIMSYCNFQLRYGCGPRRTERPAVSIRRRSTTCCFRRSSRSWRVNRAA